MDEFTHFNEYSLEKVVDKLYFLYKMSAHYCPLQDDIYNMFHQCTTYSWMDCSPPAFFYHIWTNLWEVQREMTLVANLFLTPAPAQWDHEGWFDRSSDISEHFSKIIQLGLTGYY
uniref:Uncharacterized protein n=1 Tax=Strombidium inclinatum TaxID=197538 RepID=A0A7S3IYF2_9SPIT|mmetsp:Transcript_9460/g.14512  ORF Transcript_9460/g.14512 Transcript_9460/m.14512 type:complete len:115 (+) Transcript_9460:299-643(+)